MLFDLTSIMIGIILGIGFCVAMPGLPKAIRDGLNSREKIGNRLPND